MKIKIFKKEDAIIRKIADSYFVSNFLTADYSDKMSVAVGNANEHNETTKTSSDRAYFVIEGEIVVNNDIVGKAGDVVFIPARIRNIISKGVLRLLL